MDELFEELPPCPPSIDALIVLLADAMGDRGRQDFTREFLRNLVAYNPNMSLAQFAAHVEEALKADLTKPGGGFLPTE